MTIWIADAGEYRCRIEGFPRFYFSDVWNGKIASIRVVQARDLDGDGHQDLAVNVDAHQKTVGDDTYAVGFLVIVLGRPSFPAVLNCSDLPTVEGLPPLSGGDKARNAVAEGIGDVDGDGFDDLAIDCEGFGDGGDPDLIFRAIHIVFGRPVWPDRTTIEAEEAAGRACEFIRVCWQAFPPDDTVRVFGIGDQDRDGTDDIGVNTRSKFRIVGGGSRAKLGAPRNLPDDANYDAVFPVTPTTNGRLGLGAGGRDFDGDGTPDILLCDVHRVIAPPPGRAIVLFGGDLDRRQGPLGEIEGALQLLNHDPEADYPKGFYFAGDLDGDRHEDLVVMTFKRVWMYFNPLGALDRVRPFRRGDANLDGAADISDAVAILGSLFLGDGELPCLDAADCDDSGVLDISDPIFLLGSLFQGIGPLPAPYPGCGEDPTEDGLGCKGLSGCK